MTPKGPFQIQLFCDSAEKTRMPRVLASKQGKKIKTSCLETEDGQEAVKKILIVPSTVIGQGIKGVNSGIGTKCMGNMSIQVSNSQEKLHCTKDRQGRK